MSAKPKTKSSPTVVDWSDMDESEIVGKLRGFKTALGNTADNLAALCARNVNKPSTHVCNEISRELDIYIARSENMEAAYVQLIDVVQTEDKKKKYEGSLDTLNKSKIDLRQKALDALETEVKLPPVIAPAVPDGTAGDYKRINDGLRPETLTHEMTPEELRAWIRMWQSFYATGNLRRLRIEDQQAWFLRCLDKFLAGRLSSRLKPDTPIFSDPEAFDDLSCISILEDEFRRRYPIAARRHQFYTFMPPKGTPMCQVDDQLSNMAKDADIATMSEDEHVALRIVTACPDDGLRREFLKLRFMSLDNVRGTYESWEQQQNSYSQISKSYAAAAIQSVGQPSGKGKPQQQRKKKPAQPGQKMPTPNQDMHRKKLAGVCLRCGNKDHDSMACPRKDSLSCTACGKPGHSAPVCFQAARNADYASAQGATGVRSVGPADTSFDQLHAYQMQLAALHSQRESAAQQQQQTSASQLPMIEYAGQANAVRVQGASGSSRETPFMPL